MELGAVEEIANVPGWLTTVVTRLCLDAPRSRRRRREEPIKPAHTRAMAQEAVETTSCGSGARQVAFVIASSNWSRPNGASMTAPQQVTAPRGSSAQRPDASHTTPACLQNVINAVAVLNGRWAPAVLATLYVMERPCRFGELQRRITGISQKELARHLGNLAGQGVIRREAVGRTVQYSLTADGMRLLGRMKSLGEWNQDRASVSGRASNPGRTASWVDPILR